jgi:uncharacterized repeat protein (TIGR01451 family)
MKTRLRHSTLVKLLLVPAAVLVAVAAFYAWGPSPQPTAALSTPAGSSVLQTIQVPTGSIVCPVPQPGHICVNQGTPFTLAVRVAAEPAGGYIAFQTFLSYGTNLIYKPTGTADPEIIWPDATGFQVRGNTCAGCVNHGASTGVVPPFPISHYIGNVVSLSFNCSVGQSSNPIVNIPSGLAPAGTNGALFTLPNNTQLVPKLQQIFLDCIGPTPTATRTATRTPTSTRTPTPTITPTDTPTPLPPPSEQPDVLVAKSDLQDPVVAGQPIVYRLFVKNNGVQTATGVFFVDALPSQTVFKGYINPLGVCNHDGAPSGGLIVCLLGDMAPGQETNVDITVTAPTLANDVRVGNLVVLNAANEPFENTGNNKDAEQTVVLAPRADLTLIKTEKEDPVDTGDPILYNLTVDNIGNAKAGNVMIYDDLPPGVIFDPLTTSQQCMEQVPPIPDPNGKMAQVDVVCDLGSVSPSDPPITVQVGTFSPPLDRDMTIINIAFVSGDNELFAQTGNNLDIESTAVVAPPPDLAIDKTDSADPLRRLAFFKYTLTVDNIGLGAADNVVVIDNLPFHVINNIPQPVTFISASGASCGIIAPNTLRCIIIKMPPASQVVISLNVRAPTLLGNIQLKNTAAVSVGDPQDPPGNNFDSEFTDIHVCFDVSGDGFVDLANDILIMGSKYGLQTGDPGFDVIYDFDGDGEVGLVNDILQVAMNYLATCSP